MLQYYEESYIPLRLMQQKSTFIEVKSQLPESPSNENYTPNPKPKQPQCKIEPKVTLKLKLDLSILQLFKKVGLLSRRTIPSIWELEGEGGEKMKERVQFLSGEGEKGACSKFCLVKW